MNASLADRLGQAAHMARRHARAFSGGAAQDALPWRVIADFDVEIRGHVERDWRIEDERDRVLIAAVTLAETPLEDGPETIEAARTGLLDAIDYLEQAVLRFGVVNRAGARHGLGAAGERATPPGSGGAPR